MILKKIIRVKLLILIVVFNKFKMGSKFFLL